MFLQSIITMCLVTLSSAWYLWGPGHPIEGRRGTRANPWPERDLLYRKKWGLIFIGNDLPNGVITLGTNEYRPDKHQPHVIIKCKFLPNGMTAYTPLDPKKINQYFPMLAQGFVSSELVLGYWHDKMTGLIMCDVYGERGEPAIVKTIWLSKTGLLT